MTRPDLDLRFLRKIRVNADTGCWEWTGARTRGQYSSLWVGGRQHEAHRVAYRLFVGQIPDGLEIDHLCRVKHCVNPEHLEAVTHMENLARRPTAPGRRTHCPSGHAYEADNLCITKKGERRCRACARAYYHRTKGAA